MSAAMCGANHPEWPELICNKPEHLSAEEHSVAGISWLVPWVPTQEAVDWARATVLRSVEKLRRWEKEATAAGEPERAKRWRAMAYMFEHELIGGGCVIGPFHEQAPRLRADLDALRARS